MTTAAKLQRVADTKELLREAINEALTSNGLDPMPAGVPFKDYSLFVGQLGSEEPD